MSIRSMKRQMVREAMQAAGKVGALRCPKCNTPLRHVNEVSKRYTCPNTKCKWAGRIK